MQFLPSGKRLSQTREHSLDKDQSNVSNARPPWVMMHDAGHRGLHCYSNFPARIARIHFRTVSVIHRL